MVDEQVAATAPVGKRERWRRFVREVGGVVLGVVIALALGAVASEFGWWLEVREARGALSQELGELIGQGEERVHFGPCVDRRLDLLSAVVAKADADGKLPPLGPVAAPSWRTWSRGVWQSTLNAETAAHFDRELLDNYSGAYEFADLLAENSGKEMEAWTELSVLSGPGRPFTHEEAIAMRAAIGRARMLNNLMALSGVRLKQIVNSFQLGYDAGSAQDFNTRALSAYRICRPMEPPPAAYGISPMDGVIALAIRNPITRDSGGGPKK